MRQSIMAVAILALALVAVAAYAAIPAAGPAAAQVQLTPTAEVALQGTVWLADEEGNSITVIDAASNEVVTTLTGIPGPHNLQVAPEGQTVWVISGHEALALQIDAATYELLGTVPTGSDRPTSLLAQAARRST